VITVLSQVIQTWPLPHRTVAGSFLTQRGWALDESGGRLSARHPDGSTIEITFDDQGRIAQFGGQIKPR
jgi:D-alanyl-D-alanine dipeptidase